MDILAHTRLLQLASPVLPVGAYSYSQGLEWAVESGRIGDEATAGQWIADLLQHGIGRFEAPLLVSLMTAWLIPDTSEIARLNADFLASRESAELWAEMLQMSFSLNCVLNDPGDPALDAVQATLAPQPGIVFPTARPGIASAWRIAPAAATAAYLWSWAKPGDGRPERRPPRPGRRPAPAR